LPDHGDSELLSDWASYGSTAAAYREHQGALERILGLTMSVPAREAVAPYTKRLFVHHFRITSEAQLDDELAGWVREAYAVGQGFHLQ
jgi:hypothetical protein